MNTPLRARMMSASGVVGPLAASATSRALTRPALRSVIWFSRAAGMRMSQSTSRISALLTSVAPGKPWTVPCSAFQATTLATSSPSGLWIPPVESDTATTVEPSSLMSRAAIEPALPKPWTATRVLVRSMPRCWAASTIV